ncbi:kielin/chordin-like protein [Ischnura elegans]|uniref:kielin/chordin-like protein n=1 Tax=Ischnura elegans TaxID=197161 RepID=UPI001ED869C3|nr:kielin/chordin-like protein [Ischnura elegans]
MKNLGVSFALALAFAALAHGLNTVYSPDCTVCPDCVNEVHTNYSYPIPDDICSLCLCENGTPEKVRCQRGFKYDGTKGKCVHDDTGLCSPCCDDCCKSMCPPCYHGIATPIPNPKNKCWYCLCDSDGSIKQKQCPRGFRYNPDTMDCDIADPDCGDCPGVQCTGGDHEEHFADLASKDNCDFCCCRPHETSVYHKRCPWGEKFLDGTCDESTRGQCKPTRSEEYVLVDDCAGVDCPNDPTGTPLYPDPYDPHYFCQCDYGGRVHQMPCVPGYIFNFKLQTCIME